MTPSEICANAGLALSARTARDTTMGPMVMRLAPLSRRGSAGLYPEVVVQLGHVGPERRVGNHVHHPAVLHHVVAVGDRGGEPEVLLHQQHSKSLVLESAQGGADLLDDDRRQALGRLVEEQEPGS